jgi:O-antigen ligase
MFRGENGLFFYKGFLYLNIAFFFYYLDSSKRSLIISIFIAATILLTLTRGFILSLGISMFLYYVFLNGNLVKKILFLLLTLLIVVLYLMYIMPNLGDRSISNTDRIIQMKQVFESTTLFTSLIGHGFGIGVPIRPGHMEISYLEIFHKQGLFGLSFWILLFVFIVFYYSKIRTSEHRYVADAFFLGTFFIYIQTFTNPFLNNPIGMTFVIITLLVFKTLYQQKKNDLRLHTGFQR